MLRTRWLVEDSSSTVVVDLVERLVRPAAEAGAGAGAGEGAFPVSGEGAPSDDETSLSEPPPGDAGLVVLTKRSRPVVSRMLLTSCRISLVSNDE